MLDILGSRASPVCLHCNLTSTPRSLRVLQGHRMSLLNTGCKNMEVLFEMGESGCIFTGKGKGNIPESCCHPWLSVSQHFKAEKLEHCLERTRHFQHKQNNLLSPACLFRQVGITWAAVFSSTASLPKAGPRDEKRLPKQSKYKIWQGHPQQRAGACSLLRSNMSPWEP